MKIKTNRKKHQLNDKEDLKTEDVSLEKIEKYLYKIALDKNEEDNTIMEEFATKTDIEETNVKEQHNGTFQDILQEEFEKIKKDYLVKYAALDFLLKYTKSQINVIKSLYKNNDASYFCKNNIFDFVLLQKYIDDTQRCLANKWSEIEEDYINITRDISNLNTNNYGKNLRSEVVKHLTDYFLEDNNDTKQKISHKKERIFPNIVNIIKRRIKRFNRNIKKIGNFYSAVVPISDYEKHAKEKYYGGVAFNSVFNKKHRPKIITRYKENDKIKNFICNYYWQKPTLENEEANIDNLFSIEEYIRKRKNEKEIK